MIVQCFVKWCATASSRERAGAVEMLARAFAEDRLSQTDAANAVAILGFVLDDSSPKVRQALAEALADSRRLPRAFALALAGDIDAIACLIAARSPVLFESDMIDLVATGTPCVQAAIAGRLVVSMKLAAALAEVGDAGAVRVLLCNEGATIASISHRRIAERHGADASVRSVMFDRADVPADVRQTLILHLGRVLAASPFVGGAIGPQRTQRVVFDACERATALVARETPAHELPALVEHLRASGQLSTAFLIRIVCAGHVDLFAAAMVALSGRSERRVRAIVVDGRETAFHALVRAAGLPDAAAPLLRTAVQVWKETAARAGGESGLRDIDDVAATVMGRLVLAFRERQDGAGFEAVSALLNRLSVETLLGSTRESARRMAAA
ncbi:MAG: DUF2336 domain-containing protein [Rhizobiaceae bacterium]|nr:DUF2336 domain-containing protein [Rhizobiaceae bacterium]